MRSGNRSSLIPGADQLAASPGFTWGKSGNVSSNTYLVNDKVPSNTSGRIIPVTGLLTEIFVTGQNDTTVTIAIEKRNGSTLTEIATITLTSQRKKIQSYTDVSLSYGDELAVKVKSGSIKNPVVGVVVKGDSI